MTAHPLARKHVLAVVEQHLGLRVDNTTSVDLSRAIDARLHELGESDAARYHARLLDPSLLGEELRYFSSHITVGETYFFRDAVQIETMVSHVLPAAIRRAHGRRVRILSAGCSSGEEAYSMAIAILEARGHLGEVEILGIDVNPTAVARAREGTYGEWSLRQTPAPTRARHFRAKRDQFRLRDDVRAAVTFSVRSLFDESDAFFAPGSFDIVFCRNVLIYFSGPKVREAVGRLRDALSPGGALFLGHAESPHGQVAGLFAVEHEGAFHYSTAKARSVRASRAPARASVPAPRKKKEVELPSRRPPRPSRGALPRALELLAMERFAEARDILDEADDYSIDVRLARAAALTNEGNFDDAARACDRVLELMPRSPGAQYFRGVIASGRGDPTLAVTHHEAALSADPTFTPSRLQLGVLLRRAGQRKAAKQLLLGATAELSTMRDAEQAIFFPGFGRAALAAFCMSELALCEKGRAP